MGLVVCESKLTLFLDPFPENRI